jgi:hypothetical protein
LPAGFTWPALDSLPLLASGWGVFLESATPADGAGLVESTTAGKQRGHGQRQSDAWVYQDLTRRDPTLQIYTGTEHRSSSTEITFTPTPTLATGQTIWVAMAGFVAPQLHTSSMRLRRASPAGRLDRDHRPT